MFAQHYEVHAACPRSVRTALAVAILMVGTLTAAANVWGVKHINHSSLSRVGPQASDLLGREVSMYYYMHVLEVQVQLEACRCKTC